jgi:hypothetical protein
MKIGGSIDGTCTFQQIFYDLLRCLFSLEVHWPSCHPRQDQPPVLYSANSEFASHFPRSIDCFQVVVMLVRCAKTPRRAFLVPWAYLVHAPPHRRRCHKMESFWIDGVCGDSPQVTQWQGRANQCWCVLKQARYERTKYTTPKRDGYQGVQRCGLQGSISESEHLYEMDAVSFQTYIRNTGSRT